jgi:ABC-2 type transport system ATP-binding protein
MMPAVVATNIRKSYKSGTEKITAVDGISLEVKSGELFGIIGPDGAGKTSLFRILTTLLLPDEGKATVGGFDVINDYKKIRNTIGYMPGRFSLYQDLTVKENLDFFATIFRTTVDKNYDLIREIYSHIEPFKNRRAGKLSGGMKQKLALCCALIHKPTVLFLDEPTTGVDPVSRKEFWQILRSLQSQNITIIVSTPYMDEAKLCDRIAFIQKGKFLTVNTPASIIRSFPKKLYAARSEKMYDLLLGLRKLDETASCYAFGDYHHVTFKDDSTDVDDIIANLHDAGIKENIEINGIAPTIEDSFMALLKN